MGSETPLTLQLPVIDFSIQSLKPESLEWNWVRAQVRKALEDFGCFEPVFDKIPIDLRRATFETLKDLFDLPLETKQRNVSKKPYHGYVGQYPVIPLYESLGIDDSDNLPKVESFANIFWPEGNPSFCNTIQSYSEQLSELDKMIRRMILETLGVEKYMEEHMESTNYLLRFMKYKGPQTAEVKLGLAAHTDKNIITILYQDQIGGLEVQTKDGQWISAKPSPDSFVVMIGDSFHAWTNGRLHSPNHRVMMTGRESRYSAGLFSKPKEGCCIVKSPHELVDEEHPLLYKPFDYVEYLRFFYSEAGTTAESPFKAYCGAV